MNSFPRLKIRRILQDIIDNHQYPARRNKGKHKKAYIFIHLVSFLPIVAFISLLIVMSNNLELVIDPAGLAGGILIMFIAMVLLSIRIFDFLEEQFWRYKMRKEVRKFIQKIDQFLTTKKQ
jgi:hypothetical protein